MNSFLVTNYPINELSEFDVNFNNKIEYRDFVAYSNIATKYYKDTCFILDEQYFVVVEGVILNLSNLLNEYEKSNIYELICYLYECKGDSFFKEFRGAFAGAIYDIFEQKWVLFCDQLAAHPIFYHISDKGRVVFSGKMWYLTKILKLNGISRSIDEDAWKNFCTFQGYIDDRTGIKDVRRIYPGDYVIVRNRSIEVKNYHKFQINPVVKKYSAWIEELDVAFNTAVKHIIDKDKEYGYRTIVDISGGCDSRMIAFVVKKQSYDNILLINYGQSGCADYKVAQKVANELGYDLCYRSLDSGKCMLDFEENVLLENGSSIYCGITGGKEFLKSLNTENIGIEINGLLGDVYDGSMIVKDGLRLPDWRYEKFLESSVRSFNCESTFLNKFNNNELFWFYLRGMMVGMSTYQIRQNYVEPLTPFGDIEFVNVYLSIPWEVRVKDKILLRWMVERYPDAANISYSGTGITVKDMFSVCGNFKKKYMSAVRLIKKKIWGLDGMEMNPVEHWCQKSVISTELDNYFFKWLNLIENKTVKALLEEMYKGTITDRIIAITLVAYNRLFIV